MKKSCLRVLRPEEFDVDWLEYLTLEKRVYVDAPIETDAEAFKREVLDYVASIKDFVAEDWTDRIDRLWQKIVNEDCLADYLVMKKGLEAGHMNRYSVTNIVCRMQGQGIYRKDVQMKTLHMRLEGVSTENKYYNSYAAYKPKKDVRTLLNSLFSKI